MVHTDLCKKKKVCMFCMTFFFFFCSFLSVLSCSHALQQPSLHLSSPLLRSPSSWVYFLYSFLSEATADAHTVLHFSFSTNPQQTRRLAQTLENWPINKLQIQSRRAKVAGKHKRASFCSAVQQDPVRDKCLPLVSARTSFMSLSSDKFNKRTSAFLVHLRAFIFSL